MLPYDYVIDAVRNLTKLRVRELHEEEQPTALLATQQAEFNRDLKKRRKPFSIQEFCLYSIEEDKDTVDAVYGAAAMTLIKMGQFPHWALFAYRDLSKNAEDCLPPSILCFRSDNAIILAPDIRDGTCKGMVIALESASNKQLLMESPCGRKIKVKMLQVKSKIVAQENCCLDIIN